MKSFKQYLKESKEKLSEARMDYLSSYIELESCSTAFIVDIINRYASSKGIMNPRLRLGQAEYNFKKSFEGIIDDDKEEELDRELDKLEDDIRKDILKAANKFDIEVKNILKKYDIKA